MPSCDGRQDSHIYNEVEKIHLNVLFRNTCNFDKLFLTQQKLIRVNITEYGCLSKAVISVIRNGLSLECIFEIILKVLNMKMYEVKMHVELDAQIFIVTYCVSYYHLQSILLFSLSIAGVSFLFYWKRA